MMTTRAKYIEPARFNVAVHALIGLALNGGTLSSSVIAAQVNSHPTFLRRILATLANQGIVDTREGREGGYTLRVPANQLTLSDIYIALRIDQSVSDLAPEDRLEHRSHINELLSDIMIGAEQQAIQYLKKYTLSYLIEHTDITDNPDLNQFLNPSNPQIES